MYLGDIFAKIFVFKGCSFFFVLCGFSGQMTFRAINWFYDFLTFYFNILRSFLPPLIFFKFYYLLWILYSYKIFVIAAASSLRYPTDTNNIFCVFLNIYWIYCWLTVVVVLSINKKVCVLPYKNTKQKYYSKFKNY